MRILTGIETEYGLYVEGRGPSDQIEDAKALVRSFPIGRRPIWDYRYETPRADLRGFTASKLAYDPKDARFDSPGVSTTDADTRSDIVLDNGARFYNDHGHPEYATPERWTLEGLVAADLDGERVVLEAARRYSEASDREVSVYKNNTDFQGASYGTHENYLIPRRLVCEGLAAAVVPVLVARTYLCGAGKVGFETISRSGFQTSQRAEFFSETASVDTLYRRPVFNTRDEPHADHDLWARLHVIAGDANMNPLATKLKVGLVKLALTHFAQGFSLPSLQDPARDFHRVSQDLTGEMPLSGGQSARHLLAALIERYEGDDEDLLWTCRRVGTLLGDDDAFATGVEWRVKFDLLESLGLDWDDPTLKSYDLEFHNVDPELGLAFAAADIASLREQWPADREVTRAYARGLATRYDELESASWGTLTFDVSGKPTAIPLPPDRDYGRLSEGMSVESFIEELTR